MLATLIGNIDVRRAVTAAHQESRGGTGMDRTISAPNVREQNDLGQFWGRYFAEIPVCTHEDCERIAHEVDPFFPYLDDRNRCDQHRLELSPSAPPVLS
jgi:hypothetical protein